MTSVGAELELLYSRGKYAKTDVQFQNTMIALDYTPDSRPCFYFLHVVIHLGHDSLPQFVLSENLEPLSLATPLS